MEALADIVEPLFVDLRPQNNIEEMLSSIFECCKGQFCLIGFSMGWYIAQEFALKFTHRLLGLALVGVSANEYSEEDKAYQLKMVANVKEHGLKRLSTTSLRKFIHHSLYENTVLIELI
jgi:pimeloyl-ACP methyl ester carboxylesterase